MEEQGPGWKKYLSDETYTVNYLLKVIYKNVKIKIFDWDLSEKKSDEVFWEKKIKIIPQKVAKWDYFGLESDRDLIMVSIPMFMAMGNHFGAFPVIPDWPEWPKWEFVAKNWPI